MKNLTGHLRRMNWMNLKDMVLLRKKKKIHFAEWSKITKKYFQDLIDMEKQFELERKYLVLSLEDINPKRPSKGICIKITGHEEYISASDFSLFCNGSAVFNGFHYDIRVYPIKGDDIMMQVFDNNNGFTHFYQTTKSSLKTVLETLI